MQHVQPLGPVGAGGRPVRPEAHTAPKLVGALRGRRSFDVYGATTSGKHETQSFFAGHFATREAFRFAIYDEQRITIAFYYDGGPVRFEVPTMSLSAIARAGHCSVLPAGARGQWSSEGPVEYLLVAFPALFAMSRQACVMPYSGTPGPILDRIGDILIQALDAGLSLDRTDATAWSVVFGEYVSERISGKMPVGTVGRSRLTPEHLEAVIDFVDSNLDRAPKIAELADVAGMSCATFYRSFKRLTSMSPHQFIVVRRTLMVKDLLGGSERPLSEIAKTAGFSSQSHMTRLFRRLSGITPQAYREWYERHAGRADSAGQPRLPKRLS